MSFMLSIYFNLSDSENHTRTHVTQITEGWKARHIFCIYIPWARWTIHVRNDATKTAPEIGELFVL